MLITLKIAIAALAIAFSSWLAGKKPEMAGFIIALPLASIIALAYAQLEHKNAEASITFAKSILIGVPVSWLFFLPFFFASKLGDNFWVCYVIGLALLPIGYFLHQWMFKFFS